MAKTIFISYRDDEEGRRYKNLLAAWFQNDASHFNLKFGDNSIGTSINSESATYIKSKIKDKIQESDVFLCLVGENTGSSEWVDWEIETAYSLGKKIRAVKIKSNYTSPKNLLNKGATWAHSFTLDSIKKVLS